MAASSFSGESSELGVLQTCCHICIYRLLGPFWTDSRRGPRQLGVVKYLQQHFDLSKVQLRGASAGGLVATLCACNVDPERAVRLHPRPDIASQRVPDVFYEHSKGTGWADCRALAGWLMNSRWRIKYLRGAWGCWASGAAWCEPG